MAPDRWLPRGLAGRFALAAAGIAVGALLVTSLATWWLIDRQQALAAHELADRETGFRAISVGADLQALAERIQEIAGSSILATALVDSAGRETYLVPFLRGVHQINGIPVQVMLTDFAGTEIASNELAEFTPAEREWLSSQIDNGRPTAAIFVSDNGGGAAVVALEPMDYARTDSPEGAVMYKFMLGDVDVGQSMRLTWGPVAASPNGQPGVLYADVPVPEVFAPLQLRVRSSGLPAQFAGDMPLPYMAVLALMLLLFVLVVVAGLRLARLLTLDLRRLEQFSGRLFGSGLGTVRAPTGGSAEVAGLARSINDMLDRLNEQHATLLQEREKLTTLTRALKVADRNKDNFLAMLGHELRNPLAPISNGAQLLRKMPGIDPRVARTSEIIVRQVAQMDKIVGDLLDVSRVTRGLVTLERREVDVGTVVAAAIEQLQPIIDAAGHTLETVVPDGEHVVVFGDHARLVQVLGNLLGNAAKYTPSGGRITLAMRATRDEVTLEVQDNGVGMPAELVPEIFGLFTQGTRGADRSQGGLGLGLALARHLVELHHGRITAASPGPGQGSTFTVTLPRVREPLLPPAAADGAAPGATAGAALPAAQHTPSLRVLVVDDNVDAAQTLGQWLASEGHRVDLAHDGDAALALAAQSTPDACILDIGLPGMDGLELARHLRRMAPLRDCLLIALTGYGQASDREKSTAAGFDHHLVKPTDPAQLRTLLARHATRG